MIINLLLCFPLLSLHAEVKDKQLKNSEDFVWAIEAPLTGKFIIDVEFLDLKTASSNVLFGPLY